ncbi:MAG: TldD/PmbA family protein [Methanomassiliicoccales archaeon]
MREEDLCHFVLEICKHEGATDAVVMLHTTKEKMIRFSNNQITIAKNISENSASIYVQVMEKKAHISVADLSKTTLKAAAKKAVKAANKCASGSVYAPLPKGPFKYDERLLKQTYLSFDADLLVDGVKDAIDAAIAEGADRVAGSLSAVKSEITILTTGDVLAKGEKSTIELSVRAFTSDLSSGQSVSIAVRPEDFSPRTAGEEAGRLAKLSTNPDKGEPGEFPTVIGPLVLADLASQVGRFASAFYVDAGISFLGDKLGQQVASHKFNLCDDATMPDTFGASAFDAEGLPTKRTEIIKNGILMNYLHNSATAKKFGTDSTANAGLVIPRPFNMIVDSGDSSVEKILSSIDDGLYLTNDWYLRYHNYKTGDFSTIPRDAMFKIRKGEIEKPVRELRVSDNLLRLLGRIQQLSKERIWVRWWEVEIPVLAPYALIDSLRFTKSTD